MFINHRVLEEVPGKCRGDKALRQRGGEGLLNSAARKNRKSFARSAQQDPGEARSFRLSGRIRLAFQKIIPDASLRKTFH